MRIQETRGWFLGQQDPFEKEVAPHSGILAWKIPWTEEPGGLWSMGSLRVGHNWATSLSCIGEGNGNPLQYSCLENPMDRGAWWATVHGIARVGKELVTNHHTRIQKAKHPPNPGFLLPELTIWSSSGQWKSGRNHWEELWEHTTEETGKLVLLFLAHVPPTWDPDSEDEKCSSSPAATRWRPHAEEEGAANGNLGQMVSLSYYPN